jgi:hypothetical protein
MPLGGESPADIPSSLGRSIALPLSFALFGVGFVALYATQSLRSYLATGAMGLADLPGLLAPVVKDFAFLHLSILAGYGRSRNARAMSLTLASVVLLANSIQLLSVVYSNEYVTPSVVRMSQVMAYAVTPTTVAATVAVVAAIVAFSVGIGKLGIEALSLRQRVGGGIAILLFAYACHARSRTERTFDLEAKFGLDIRRSPTLALGRSLIDARRSEPEAPTPTAAQVAAAAKFGIEVRPDAFVPFMKDHLYKTPLPYPRRPAATLRPNVVAFFLESLSADLLGPYNPAHAAMTPNFVDFANAGTRIDDYVNHTTPTVTSLRGQLCSTYPRLAWTPWFEAKSKPKTARILCLSHVLRESAYESVYLSHAAANDTYLESQFIDFGFNDSYFRDRVLTELVPGEAPQRDGQPGDDQMLRATVRFLKARPPTAAPLFLAVSTIETHTGFDSPTKWGDGKNRVLNTFHHLDLAFGRFWSWFKQSRYAKDTIVIVTGDHTLYPQDLLRQVSSSRSLNNKFDHMALLVYDPVHTLPPAVTVRTTSIDFAPTVLQLLEIPRPRANAFLGLSMFGDRAGLGGGLGLVYNNSLFYWDGGDPKIVDDKSCDPDACGALAVLKYNQRLEAENRLWRD